MYYNVKTKTEQKKAQTLPSFPSLLSAEILSSHKERSSLIDYQHQTVRFKLWEVKEVRVDSVNLGITYSSTQALEFWTAKYKSGFTFLVSLSPHLLSIFFSLLLRPSGVSVSPCLLLFFVFPLCLPRSLCGSLTGHHPLLQLGCKKLWSTCQKSNSAANSQTGAQRGQDAFTHKTDAHTHTHLKTVPVPQRDKQPLTLTLTYRVNLESPINLTRIFLDGGRKPEYLERTHAYTGRTRKLHTERPQPGFNPIALLLWGDSANHHTTVKPNDNNENDIENNTDNSICIQLSKKSNLFHVNWTSF